MDLKNSTLITYLKTVSFPGFDKVPLYEVGRFFFRSLQRGALTTRASAVAFNLFIAIFPGIIFIFTLIPYLPFSNFQHELLMMMKNIMPQNAYLSIEGTITDIIVKPRNGLLSFGFIAALYFSTNGIVSMISAFNATYLTFDNRPWWSIRLLSFGMVIILFLLISIAVSLIIFSGKTLNYFVMKDWMEQNIYYYLITIGNWVIITALFFFAISILYYLAPAKKTRWRFISAGSTLSTVLIIIASIGFSYFVNNFGQYNKLYGSIGTIIVILLWLYFNSLALIIGFELNTSIINARSERHDINN